MRKLFGTIIDAPLDVKIFFINPLLLIGIFFLPNEPRNVTLYTTYIVFIFVSIAVSGFFVTWIRDSEYNILRKAKTSQEVFITLLTYIGILVVVSYILSITEWFLLIFGR
jgi:hypothetical protein